MTRVARWLRRRGVPLVALLLVVGLVGWGFAFSGRLDSEPSNRALVDKTATAQVQTEVSRVLAQVLSYDYSDPELMKRAADELLVGDAREEHRVLFEALRKRAEKQQLVLSAQVQAAAVKQLDDDSAVLLVFLDQSSQRAKDKETSVSAAQLAVKAVKVAGHWRVSSLHPL